MSSGDQFPAVSVSPPPGTTDYSGLLNYALSRIEKLEKEFADLRSEHGILRAADDSFRRELDKLSESVAKIERSLDALRASSEEDRKKLDAIIARLDKTDEDFGKLMAALAEQTAATSRHDEQLSHLTTKVDAFDAKQDAQTSLLEDIKKVLPKNKAVLAIAYAAMVVISGCVSGFVHAIGPKVAPQLFDAPVEPHH